MKQKLCSVWFYEDFYLLFSKNFQRKSVLFAEHIFYFIEKRLAALIVFFLRNLVEFV